MKRQFLILFFCCSHLLFLSIHADNKLKKALIFGVTGQDGAYLTEFLLSKNYEVHGVKRQSSTPNIKRIDQFYKDVLKSDNKFFLHFGDLADSGSIIELIKKIQPDEIYNLAAQSH